MKAEALGFRGGNMVKSTICRRSLGFLGFLAVFGSLMPAAFAEPADYSVYPHLERTEYLEGVSHSVAAYSLWDRDFFAVANEESDLHIFQVVDGNVVAKGIGPTVGLDRDVAIKDWYAFVSTNSGLTAVNVAVPETPTQVGFINLAGDCTRVDVSATHAFVACGSEGLAVVDITDPQNMVLVDTYGAGTHVKAVCVDGDRLGIVNHQGFEILDISEPDSPVLLGSLALASNFNNCVLQGDLAYVSAFFQIKQLDLTDPAAIAVMQVHDLYSHRIHNRRDILGSELLYVGYQGLGFVDFATGTVTRVSQQAGDVNDAAIIGGKILAAGNNRVEVFEDGHHLNPGAGDVPEAGLMEPRGLVLGNMLYGLSLATGNTLVATELGSADGLRWHLDLESDGSPVRGMAQRNSTLVTLTALGDLSVVLVSRNGAIIQGTLSLVGGFYTPYNQDRTVAWLDDQTVVVLDEQYPGSPGTRNIRVVDLANPEQPVQIGQYSMTLDYPEHVMVAGQLVVATSWGGGYEIFDAQDRMSLQSLGVHDVGPVGNSSVQFHAQDSWLYVLNDDPVSPIGEVGPERLDTWDLSDPVTPALVHQLNLASSGNLVFAGDWAYQAESGLVLDLSDPSAPAPAGNMSSPPNLASVVAGTEYIVTGDLFDGPDSFGQYLVAQGSSGGISAVRDDIPLVDTGLSLVAVPNPFNPKVTLRFELPAESSTHLEIFDLRGRLVADLGEKHREAGPHGINWTGIDRQGRNLPSGVYLARLRTPTATASQKIVLAR